jgi:hypothetical protein
MFLLAARLLSALLTALPSTARQCDIRPGAQQKEPHAGERSDQRYCLE